MYKDLLDGKTWPPLSELFNVNLCRQKEKRELENLSSAFIVPELTFPIYFYSIQHHISNVFLRLSRGFLHPVFYNVLLFSVLLLYFHKLNPCTKMAYLWVGQLKGSRNNQYIVQFWFGDGASDLAKASVCRLISVIWVCIETLCLRTRCERRFSRDS